MLLDVVQTTRLKAQGFSSLGRDVFGMARPLLRDLGSQEPSSQPQRCPEQGGEEKTQASPIQAKLCANPLLSH